MIPRDGACTSLWQYDMERYTPANEANQDLTYDVIIAGGGITGITTAWQLQKTGKNCLVIEAHNIGFGTTGGTTAHLNTLLDTPYTTLIKNFGEENAKLVAEAARDAINLVKENIHKLAIDCGFKEAAAFLFSQDQKQTEELNEIYKASQKAGLQIAYSEKIPVPIPFQKALRVEKQAKFNPLQYVYALAEAFETTGGTILQNTRVTGVEGDDILTITTENGTFTTRAMVFATHIPIGINLLHLRCAPYRSYAMAVRLKQETDYPQGLIYDSQDPYHYYRTQEVKGVNYLIAGGYDHRTAMEENTEKNFLELEAHVRKYYEVDEVMYAWSSQYFEPADGLPYIGHLPGHSANTLVATGFGGNGMTYSQVSALVICNILNGKNDPCIKLFDPNRVKPVAGFVNFIKHNAQVAGEIISKIWPADKMGELVELAPGDGKIVRYEEHTIALHKDEKGNLHALHPECTHMKCTIAWNAAENSWDCPCHGARFSIHGEVLTGPAATALEKVAIGQ
jgi:glycine/D-amino acid oxidase-like deaminating enzyme/nitrite reductase/ring-hydroxylating ferredoxin subunit